MTRFLALFALVLPLPALAGVQPGQWQLTVEVSLSQGASPTGPIVETRCISEEEARDPKRVFTDPGRQGCVFSDARDTGTQYTFTLDCRGGTVPVHGSGRVDYTAETIDGVIDLIAEQSNLRVVTQSKVHGRRLGACKS